MIDLIATVALSILTLSAAGAVLFASPFLLLATGLLAIGTARKCN